MSEIVNKLRLIQEGFTIQEINSGQAGFSSLIETTDEFLDETSIFMESTMVDVRFISESQLFNESAIDTIKQKVKKFFAWILDKLKAIINWIRSKFFQKTEDVQKVADRVEKKIESGEIDKKLEDLKNGTSEPKKDETPPKTEPKSEPTVEPKSTPKSEPKVDKSASDQKTQAQFVQEQIKVRAAKRVLEEKMKDISDAAAKMVKITKDANLVATNFNSPLAALRGPRKADSIEAFILNKLSDGEINKVDELAEYICGTIEEVELSSGLGKKIIKTVGKLKENAEELIKTYKIYQEKIHDWQDYVQKTLDGVTDDSREKVSEHLDYMLTLNTKIMDILSRLMSINSKTLAECEKVLNKLDSL